MNNGLTDEYDNLLKKTDGFKACLRTLEKKGKVPAEQIPPKLTSALLFNVTIEKRNEGLMTLMKLLQKEKLFIQDQVKNRRQKDKSVLLNYAKRDQEINKWIATMKGMARNPWAPCPLYHEESNFIEVQAVHKDIKEGELVLDYVPDPSLAQNSNYVVVYELRGDRGVLNGEFAGASSNRVSLQLPDRNKNIHEYDLTVQLQEKQCFLCNPIRGKISTKLLALEESYMAEYKPAQGKFKVVAKVRAPCNGSNTELKETKEVVIDRLYPAFREIAAAPQPKQLPASTLQPKPSNPNPPTKVGGSQAVEKKKTLTADPPLPKVLEGLPEGVGDVDIRDPDNVGNLVCASYLEKRIGVLNSQISQVAGRGGKIPDAVKNRVNLMVRNNAILQGNIESGKLSPEQYKEYLGRQLVKDKAALEYLEKYKQNTKAALVRERIECINKELVSFN
eukprot:TRINITY_DN716_c0_g3_i1.p1 TRINITY_DN716_c0_g3~~TRINITY_DN716_c0_g3_i1.p1  ORF type:complete len:447 (+),score=111.31 TRINITY_DN716_c0_g3_i1:831-2171(+)